MASNLSIRILGEADQGIIPQFEFRSGEERTLKFQLYDTQDNQKVCIPSTATKTLVISSTTATDLTITNTNITQDTNDLSVFSVTLTEAQTATLQTGWLQFTYTIPGTSPNVITRIAYKEWAIKKVTS